MGVCDPDDIDNYILYAAVAATGVGTLLGIRTTNPQAVLIGFLFGPVVYVVGHLGRCMYDGGTIAECAAMGTFAAVGCAVKEVVTNSSTYQGAKTGWKQTKQLFSGKAWEYGKTLRTKNRKLRQKLWMMECLKKAGESTEYIAGAGTLRRTQCLGAIPPDNFRKDLLD